MTISPPHAHSGCDIWLTEHRCAHLLRDAHAHSASLCSTPAAAAKPRIDMVRLGTWLGIFIGIPLFWAAVIFLFT